MSTQLVDLFDVFSETFGKEKAHRAVKDIEDFVSDHKRELATKHDLTETELRLTREIEKVRSEIEQAKSSTIKWVVSWVAGLLIAYTGAIFTMITLMKYMK